MRYIFCDFDERNFHYSYLSISLCPFGNKVLSIKVDYIPTYVFKVK